jgi:uncharacterized protein
VIYLDTSAFLKLYVREEESQFVEQRIQSQDEPVPVTDLLQSEFVNALRLKVYWEELDAPTADHLIALFDDRLVRGQYFVPTVDRIRLLQDARELSGHTPSIGCRTLDILHVAFALQLEPAEFITFDSRQAELARRAGLQVEPTAP